MTMRSTYIVTIDVPPATSDPDGIGRMKRALKSMLRRFDLRCRSIELAATADQAGPRDGQQPVAPGGEA